MRNNTTLICCLFLLVSVAGCGLFPPKSQTHLPVDLPATWSNENHIGNLPITYNLLELFDDDELKTLVQEALTNNPNLSATAHRLKAAGFLLGKTRSPLLPHVNAEFSAGRDNQGVGGGNGEKRITHSHRISLGINWEIDLWGRLADEHNASKQDVLAKEQDYLQARDALATRVIQTWINSIGLKRSVEIEQERLAVLKHIWEVLVKRYKNGLGDLDEISTAASRTEIARADVSVQKTAFKREKRTMALLLGRYPGNLLVIPGKLPKVLFPSVNPPAIVLLKRPDIWAALARVESARLLANSADKARIPGLTLSGQLFREAARLNNIGNAASYWSVFGSLLQPIFDGGRLKAKAQAGHTEFQASLMDLRATVLKAINEVEDGFSLERDFKAQVNFLVAASRESERSSNYYTERYRQGLDTIQNLLLAKEQEMAVKSRLNRVVTDRLSNRIDLALALGVELPEKDVSGQEI